MSVPQLESGEPGLAPCGSCSQAPCCSGWWAPALELLLIGHYESVAQWAPTILLAIGLVSFTWHLCAPGRSTADRPWWSWCAFLALGAIGVAPPCERQPGVRAGDVPDPRGMATHPEDTDRCNAGPRPRGHDVAGPGGTCPTTQPSGQGSACTACHRSLTPCCERFGHALCHNASSPVPPLGAQAPAPHCTAAAGCQHRDRGPARGDPAARRAASPRRSSRDARSRALRNSMPC